MWMDRSTHQRHISRSLCSPSPFSSPHCSFPMFTPPLIPPQSSLKIMSDLHPSTTSFHPSCFLIVLCWTECVSLVRLLLSLLRPSLVSLPSLYLFGLLHKAHSAMTVFAWSLQNKIKTIIRLVQKNRQRLCPVHTTGSFFSNLFLGSVGKQAWNVWESLKG